MRQAYRILPVYTGDVSGVCSALYELGGMVVMHDPSGCNSTYNTHDETRWYDRDSLIFLSGLCEPDAVMGNDAKLIEDVVRAAGEFSPRFIALCNSPIPYLTGTDFAGVCRIIENRTGIPAFYIPTNGMHDYISGAGLAFEKLAEELFGEPGSRETDVGVAPGKKRSLNILGMTPLDYAAESCVSSLRGILEQDGWEITSVWAVGDSLDKLEKAGESSVNLVISASGLRTAEYLNKRFGTPWVAGVPLGSMRGRVNQALVKTAGSGVCTTAYETCERDIQGKPQIIVIGEPVMSCSIAQDYEDKGLRTLVIAATEESGKLIRPTDRICRGEEEVEETLAQFCAEDTLVIADPLYRYVIPKGTAMEPVPHLAFSGRLYRSSFKDPFVSGFMSKGGSDES